MKSGSSYDVSSVGFKQFHVFMCIFEISLIIIMYIFLCTAEKAGKRRKGV